MTRRALLLFSLALFVPLFVAPADAQTAIGGPQETIYRLTPASTYQDGCFDPCACPVQLQGGLNRRLQADVRATRPFVQ
jgi:hypothetical protein